MRDSERELTTADMAQPKEQPSQADLTSRDSRETSHLRAVPTPDRTDDASIDSTPLLGDDETRGFRTRWDSIQAQFVDDPRHAVEEADHLVAEAMQRLAQVFSEERADLEQQWDRGDDVSTEDLRVSLRHYRAFFQRLLAA